MATSGIDKSLYAAPIGIMEEAGPPIEIEIEDPEEVRIGMGDIEIDLKPRKETAEDFDANLADYMDASELDSLGSELIDEFERP